MKVQPQMDYMIVEWPKEETKLVLPENVKRDFTPKALQVLTVGPGLYVDGKIVAPDVKPGDRVLLSPLAFDPNQRAFIPLPGILPDDQALVRAGYVIAVLSE